MAKDTYYFQHDYNARNDEKILELRVKFGLEGYGLYWMILESMAETDDGKLSYKRIGGLSLGYGVAIARLKEVIDFCIEIDLLSIESDCFFSKRLMEHKDFRQKLSEGGTKGAAKKWKKEGIYSQPIAPPIAPPMALPMQRKGKERKGNILGDVKIEKSPREILIEQWFEETKEDQYVLEGFCKNSGCEPEQFLDGLEHFFVTSRAGDKWADIKDFKNHAVKWARTYSPKNLAQKNGVLVVKSGQKASD